MKVWRLRLSSHAFIVSGLLLNPLLATVKPSRPETLIDIYAESNI
jgi:hypothetical protein